MPWSLSGPFADWPNRKKITVPAGLVVGSSSFTDHPLFAALAGDSDINAGAHPTGRNLAFADATGETKIPHKFNLEGQFLGLNGAHLWFQGPEAIYDPGEDKSWYAIVQKDFQYLYELDHATGIIRHVKLRTGGLANPDDHDGGVPLIRSVDKKFMATYTEHAQSAGHDLRDRISTHAIDSVSWDVTAFEAETTHDPDGSSIYAYPSLIEVEDDSEIWKIFRFENSQRAWGFVKTSNSGAVSWSGFTTLWDTDRGFPYLRAIKNGSGRIDFLATRNHPNDPAGGNSLCHFYYQASDDTFRTSAGVDMGSPPFNRTDATVIFDIENCWIEDLTIKADGNPRVTFSVYPSNVASNQDLWEGDLVSGIWSTQKIADTGTGVVALEPYYTGGSVFMPGNEDKLYCGIEVEGVYEQQLWSRAGDGTWSKTDDITKGSSGHQFRPRRVEGSSEAKEGHVFWMCGPYNDYNDFDTSVRIHPNAVKPWAHTTTKETIDGASDTEIYCYYGNKGADDQQDAANVLNANHIAALQATVPLDEADPLKFEDPTGTLTVTYDSEMDPDQSHNPPPGDAWTFNQGSTVDNHISCAGLDLAGKTALTVMVWCKPTDLSGVDQQPIVSNWGSTNNQAAVLLRADPNNGDKIEVFVRKQTDAPQSGSTIATLTEGSWNFVVCRWSAANGLKATINKTHRVVDATTGGAIDATASPDLQIGGWVPNDNDNFPGMISEVRILDTELSDDELDTMYDAWTSGIITIGPEETNSVGGVTLSPGAGAGAGDGEAPGLSAGAGLSPGAADAAGVGGDGDVQAGVALGPGSANAGGEGGAPDIQAGGAVTLSPGSGDAAGDGGDPSVDAGAAGSPGAGEGGSDGGVGGFSGGVALEPGTGDAVGGGGSPSLAGEVETGPGRMTLIERPHGWMILDEAPIS